METIKFETRGKVPNGTANKLLNNMLAVAQNCKETRNAIRTYLNGIGLNVSDIDAIDSASYSRIYHALRDMAEFDMSYGDTHPAYSPWVDIHGNTMPARKRRIPFCGWSMSNDYYGGGCNDTHWDTVQNQVKTQFETELLNILKSA